MFNRALELIETKEYFGVEPRQAKVLSHPECPVAFNLGALMLPMGSPDMRQTIGFALNWPNRRASPVDLLDLTKTGCLNFEAPDEVRFPALRLARGVRQIGGLAGAIFSAAKERVLDSFISGKIGFLEMAPIVEDVLTEMSYGSGHKVGSITLDNVVETNHLARIRAGEAIAALT